MRPHPPLQAVPGSQQTSGGLAEDAASEAWLMETLSAPTDDQSVPVVITITLLLTLIIGLSGTGGLVASVVLCAMAAGLAKARAASSFWIWLPATFSALGAIGLIGHVV